MTKHGPSNLMKVLLLLGMVAVLALALRDFHKTESMNATVDGWMSEASSINSAFGMIDGLRVMGVKDDEKEARLDGFPNAWGAVLSDGTVILNPNVGKVMYKPGAELPSGWVFMPAGGDAFALQNVDLPESWRGRFLITVKRDEAAACYVIVFAGDGSVQAWRNAEGGYEEVSDPVGAFWLRPKNSGSDFGSDSGSDPGFDSKSDSVSGTTVKSI